MLMMLIMGWSLPALASNDPVMDEDLRRIDAAWAHIKYQVTDQAVQRVQFEALAKTAGILLTRYPGKVEPLVWNGVVLSELAGVAGMFDQLSYAKQALQNFNQAAAIDPTALHGVIQLSLGVIYYRVPGWPISFGDTEKARTYLEAALALDPDGMDVSYFYGEFLVKQGDDAKARAIFLHGLAAPIDPDRPVWDAGRRAEIRESLARIELNAAR
jgi:tetratricopeptide (TPR) repeat protein